MTFPDWFPKLKFAKMLMMVLTLKATGVYSHLIAMSAVLPGYATTPPPLPPPPRHPIGQAIEKPANRRVAGEGEGVWMMQYCS